MRTWREPGRLADYPVAEIAGSVGIEEARLVRVLEELAAQVDPELGTRVGAGAVARMCTGDEGLPALAAALADAWVPGLPQGGENLTTSAANLGVSVLVPNPDTHFAFLGRSPGALHALAWRLLPEGSTSWIAGSGLSTAKTYADAGWVIPRFGTPVPDQKAKLETVVARALAPETVGNFGSVALVDITSSGNSLRLIGGMMHEHLTRAGLTEGRRLKVIALADDPNEPALVQNMKELSDLGFDVQVISLRRPEFATFRAQSFYVPPEQAMAGHPIADSRLDGIAFYPEKVTPFALDPDALPTEPARGFVRMADALARWVDRNPTHPTARALQQMRDAARGQIGTPGKTDATQPDSL